MRTESELETIRKVRIPVQKIRKKLTQHFCPAKVPVTRGSSRTEESFAPGPFGVGRHRQCTYTFRGPATRTSLPMHRHWAALRVHSQSPNQRCTVSTGTGTSFAPGTSVAGRHNECEYAFRLSSIRTRKHVHQHCPCTSVYTSVRAV